MKKTNYHTHTVRCMHASGKDAEYVEAAIGAGYKVLGFTDHGPLPYMDGFVSGIRMDIGALQEYTASIQQLRQAHQDEIKVYCGGEYEYFPAFMPFLSDLLASGTLDYAILGNHFELDERTGQYFGKCTRPEQIAAYARCTVAGMETGLFAYLAHPDLFLHSYPVFDEAARQASIHLCRTARALDMPLEYNLFGLEKQRLGNAPGLGYPCRAFWEVVAQEGCKAIIGVDAHSPEALHDADYAAALETLGLLGIVRIEETLRF